jgi:hypothetical protein
MKKVDDTQLFRSIPPTQLVVRSYSGYTGALGGGPEFHQRSWWFVHIQHGSDQPESESERRVRLAMNNPPTALVGFKGTLRSCL